jgi:hypothetical protein
MALTELAARLAHGSVYPLTMGHHPALFKRLGANPPSRRIIRLLGGIERGRGLALARAAHLLGMSDVSDAFIDDLRYERALRCDACGHTVVSKDRSRLMHDMWTHIQRAHPGELDWDEEKMAYQLNKHFGLYGPYEMSFVFRGEDFGDETAEE